MPLRTGHFPTGHFPSGVFPPGHWPAPPIFPVSLDEIKDYLRIDYDDEDFILVMILRAAVSWAEMFQSRFFIKRMTIEYLDKFPDTICPDWSKLQDVDSIKYYDTGGTLQLLDSDSYTIDNDTEPGRIDPAYGYSWPSTYEQTNSVIVTYSAGYGTADDVPDDIKTAVKMIVQYIYQRQPNNLLNQAKKLLWLRKLVSI